MKKKVLKPNPENIDKAVKRIIDIVKKDPSDEFFDKIEKTDISKRWKNMYLRQLEQSLLALFKDKIMCKVIQNNDRPTSTVRFYYEEELSILHHRNTIDDVCEIINRFKQSACPEIEQLKIDNEMYKKIIELIGNPENKKTVKKELDWNAKLYLGDL